MDMLNVRQCILINGSIACGKTTVINTTCNVLNRIRDNELSKLIRDAREKAGKDQKHINDEFNEDELTDARKYLIHHGCNT